MRSVIPALLLLAPVLHAAEEAVPAPKKKVAAFSLLPVGSELKGVMLPRYDKNQQLAGVLKAKGMTLVTGDTIAGETVSVEFFNPDQSQRARVDLVKAVFNQTEGTLDAREPVTIRSEQFKATGTGMLYAFEQGEGILLGPVTSWTRKPVQTTMNTSHLPLRAAVGAALLAQSLVAATPPPPVSDGGKSAIQADAASKAPEHAAAAKETRADLARNLAASDAANAKVRAFLEKADLAAKTADAAPEPAAAQPLDIKPGPDDTVIRCDGGMYFNADEGVFVYLKNVRVTDPRFNLTGANELKIFLGKKPVDPAKAKPEKDTKDKPASSFGKFDEVERVVATGAVLIEQKATADGKDPAKASGSVFVYNVKEDLATVTGGYPWLLMNGVCVRARQPDLIVRMQPKAGHASAGPGDWETIVNLEQLQKK